MNLPAFLSLFILSTLSINSTTFDIKDVEVEGIPYASQLKYESMYSEKDAPQVDYKPTITYELKFKSEKAQNAYLVIGMMDSLLKEEGTMSPIFECLFNDIVDTPTLKKIKIDFNENGEAKLSGTFDVEESGLYSAFIETCEYKVTLNGYISFRNPYGYLPGHKYLYLKFYGIMMAIYIILLAGWIILLYKYNSETLAYHYLIGGILWFTLLEVMLNFIEMHVYNTHGHRGYMAYILARISCIIRKTLSRIVIIIVCAGYGIAKSKISKNIIKFLSVISFIYFLTNFIFEIYKFEHYATKEVNYVLLTLEIIILILNGIYYVWIFSALSDTLDALNSHEYYKLKLYNHFGIFLILTLISAIIFNLYYVNYRRNIIWSSHTTWSMYWFLENGYWLIQSTSLVFFTMIIWRPNKNSSRYAYHQQLPTTDEKTDKFTIDLDSDEDNKLPIAKTLGVSSDDSKGSSSSSLDIMYTDSEEFEKPIKEKEENKLARKGIEEQDGKINIEKDKSVDIKNKKGDSKKSEIKSLTKPELIIDMGRDLEKKEKKGDKDKGKSEIKSLTNPKLVMDTGENIEKKEKDNEKRDSKRSEIKSFTKSKLVKDKDHTEKKEKKGEKDNETGDSKKSEIKSLTNPKLVIDKEDTEKKEKDDNAKKYKRDKKAGKNKKGKNKRKDKREMNEKKLAGKED